MKTKEETPQPAPKRQPRTMLLPTMETLDPVPVPKTRHFNYYVSVVRADDQKFELTPPIIHVNDGRIFVSVGPEVASPDHRHALSDLWMMVGRSIHLFMGDLPGSSQYVAAVKVRDDSQERVHWEVRDMIKKPEDFLHISGDITSLLVSFDRRSWCILFVCLQTSRNEASVVVYFCHHKSRDFIQLECWELYDDMEELRNYLRVIVDLACERYARSENEAVRTVVERIQREGATVRVGV